LEKARQEKLIGNSLEARVILKCDRKVIGSVSKEELEEFFILSDLIIEDAPEASAIVEKTPTENARVAGVIAKVSGKVAPIPICATAAKASSRRPKKWRGELLRVREKRRSRVYHPLEERASARPSASRAEHRLAVCAPNRVLLR
jgi:hypothetical protein